MGVQDLAYPGFADAAATDPTPHAALFTAALPGAGRDAAFYDFPARRYWLSHIDRIRPVTTIAPTASPTPFDKALAPSMNEVEFVPLGRSQPLTWADSLTANYADGIIILHRGRIVQESYFGALSAERPHISFSVTKSLVGLAASVLIAQGQLDPRKSGAHYVSALRDCAFGDATVDEILDMTTALGVTEDFTALGSDAYRMLEHSGFLPPSAHNPTNGGTRTYAQSVRKCGAHGVSFAYRTVNTDALAWILFAITGQHCDSLIRSLFWDQLGREQHAYMVTDPSGTPFAGGGLGLCLRDLARFGELMRCDGAVGGRQLVPSNCVADIRTGGSSEAFHRAGLETLPGWRYRRMWWGAPPRSAGGNGAFMARGIHGQALYVDPDSEVVIARFASHPMASNLFLDPMSIPAYTAICDALRAR